VRFSQAHGGLMTPAMKKAATGTRSMSGQKDYGHNATAT
jgi:hypothetical protein